MAVRKHKGVVVGGRKAPALHLLEKGAFFESYAREFLDSFAVPDEFDYSAKAASVLRDPFLNTEYGCCVIAGGYHVKGVTTGNAWNLFHATKAQIISDYSAIGGFNPADPEHTDNGCDEQSAFEYWKNHGFANGHKLLGWLQLDGTNVKSLKTACYLFENLFFGIPLPDAWIQTPPVGDGFVWDVAGAPDPNNGHCVIGFGCKDGVKIDSWGLKGTLTFDAIAKYATQGCGGMVYALLDPDQVMKGMLRVPSGIDWTKIIQDFKILGGNVGA